MHAPSTRADLCFIALRSNERAQHFKVMTCCILQRTVYKLSMETLLDDENLQIDVLEFVDNKRMI